MALSVRSRVRGRRARRCAVLLRRKLRPAAMSDHSAIDAAIESLALTVTAEFVPFSKSRFKAERMASLNYRVTIKRNGRDVLTTDYMMGQANCPAYKNPSKFPSGKRDGYTTEKRISEEC